MVCTHPQAGTTGHNIFKDWYRDTNTRGQQQLWDLLQRGRFYEKCSPNAHSNVVEPATGEHRSEMHNRSFSKNRLSCAGSFGDEVVQSDTPCGETHLDQWHVEALAPECVVLEARLVANPLLVHLFVEARQDAHHLSPTAIHADVGAQAVAHVNGLGALQLPAASCEGIGLGGQGANGAQVDDVSAQLAGQQLVDIGTNLGITATASHTKVCRAGNLRSKAHTPAGL